MEIAVPTSSAPRVAAKRTGTVSTRKPAAADSSAAAGRTVDAQEHSRTKTQDPRKFWGTPTPAATELRVWADVAAAAAPETGLPARDNRTPAATAAVGSRAPRRRLFRHHRLGSEN